MQCELGIEPTALLAHPDLLRTYFQDIQPLYLFGLQIVAQSDLPAETVYLRGD